ncbi:hypothetical protein C8A05DRAFT_34934 [Staphylotrichum tortipilum]|uniref:Uncharacterized protein n=1 Tax=Staphylotrichum tortipilum TaxID=2831512 RepID=A0AAN6MJJ7_9PEZI|nr:hypothetical protein C8A05DRAFT_34934 [Staphylotrichum longicolle]
MPNLVAIDVSVTDGRVRLAFSDRAVATAYAAYLRAQDLRPAHHQAIPGYRRTPHLHSAAKLVTLSLPEFITWFITCRLPDDEDAVTFTCMDEHQGFAARWADAMLLFERVPPPRTDPRASGVVLLDDDVDMSSSSSYSSSASPAAAAGVGAQMHVRRLWNRAGLLKRLEEMRRASEESASASAGGTPARSRVGSPGVGSPGVGSGGYGNGNGNVGGQGWWNGGNGGRAPVALTVPVPRDIWW